LWGVVDGSLTKPDQTIDPTGHNEGCKKDRDARIQIAVSLKQGPSDTIAGAKTAKACWDKLTDRFCEQRVAYLMEELFHTAIVESEPLETQINKLLQAARNLESLGFGLADNVLAFVIVMALPETMSTLKTILYNTQGSDLHSEGIVNQIIIDEQRRIRSSGLEVTAFYSNAGKNGKSKGKSDDKQKQHCMHCDIRGHDISECRKLKSSLAIEHALTSNKLIDQWIVASGASRTMCSHRDWFHSFTPFAQPTQVIPGDNSSIPATGTGHVHARFPAKGKWHRIVLQDVLYVPELHRNLLSVSHILKRGGKVRFEGNHCRIFSNSDTLIGEGNLSGNLYTLSVEIISPPNAPVIREGKPDGEESKRHG